MTSPVIEYITDKSEINTKRILDPEDVETTKQCSKACLTVYSMSLSITDDKYDGIFEYILSQVMFITKSDFGGICKKFIDEKEEYLKFVAVSIKCDKSKKFHSSELGNLLGRACQYNHIVVSNNLEKDPRSKGLPHNHFNISRFLGIPLIINDICIGQIILANKGSEYGESDIYDIYPIIKICCDTLFSVYYKKKYTITDILHQKSNVTNAKDNFISVVSHELRTPLSNIISSVTLLSQSKNLTEKQNDYIKIAITCGIQLLDLINSILDFSKLSSNTLILSREQISIRECVNKSIEIVKTSADAKNIKIDIDYLSDKFPEVVLGDQKRICQILINLLSNAIKFSGKDSKILLKIGGEKNLDALKIIFEVVDNGIGIDPADRDKIFTAFSQLKDKNAYNKQDGAGLGLAISKELVELMGGNIIFESEGRDKGTKFIFSIVVEEFINVDDFIKTNKDILENLEILNVDDKMENLMILEDMLFSWGLKSTTCNSAEQALKYLEHGKKIDIAIVDIYMPYMSGIELAQRLREKYPNIPIIGISSVGKDQGVDLFDVYLTKPYNAQEILKGILYCSKKKLLHATPIGAELSIGKIHYRTKSIAPPSKKDVGELKILMAEDDKTTQYIMRDMIEQLGYKKLKIVSDGKECLDEVKREKYDVILMDIKMPIMDGLESSKYIKLIPDHPPIIAVSAGVLETDKNMYMKAGMDGYLGKPFSSKELDSILKRFL